MSAAHSQAVFSNNHKIRVEITCMTGHNMHSYAERQGTMDDSQSHTTGYRDMNQAVALRVGVVGGQIMGYRSHYGGAQVHNCHSEIPGIIVSLIYSSICSQQLELEIAVEF